MDSVEAAAHRCQRVAHAWAAWEPLWSKVMKHAKACKAGCRWVCCEDESQDHQEYCGSCPPRVPPPDWDALRG